LYTGWKGTLRFSTEEGSNLSPPLLLNVTADYCQAERRVLFFGQETYGWDWDSNLQKNYPLYPNPWPFCDIRNCSDFLAYPESVKALCRGYKEFKFSVINRKTVGVHSGKRSEK